MIAPPRQIDLALTILLALIWASAFTAIEVALQTISPLAVAAIRLFIGALVLLPIAIKLHGWPRADLSIIGLLCVIAALNFMIPFTLIAWAQTYLTASTMALIMGTGPCFALLLSHVVTIDDRLSIKKVAACIAATGAVTLVILSDGDVSFGGSRLAILAGLCASFCYVLAGALARRIDGLPILSMTAYVLTMAAVMTMPLAAMVALPTIMPPTSTVLAVLYLGLVPTGLAFVLRYGLIRRVGLSRFSLGMSLVPVFGVAIGAFVLKESITVTVIAGTVMILISMLLAR
ncbi:permease [Tateyamaria omphalii]|uniref:DMT family transporter n=1 Tax=Tateyamaria omphalii TaxID=299262 RepID=UPI00167BBA89|nr:DMT family transporter [Tateyamaria omphalii]GGX38169.1 permease [Tateyamaria omphalii]